MTIGILGGGQLGRMLALAGYPLGLRFRFLDPAPDAPAGHVGELIVGDFNDPRAVDEFLRGVDMVTYEFENVPVECVRGIEACVPTFPPSTALATAQDRLAEKTLFARMGIGVPPFAPVTSLDELRATAATIGSPAVLKTRRMGYDGKGQSVLRTASDAEAAWRAVGGDSAAARGGLILESFVAFDCEMSILGVRGRDGSKRFYPLVQNVHESGILRVSRAPAPLGTPALQSLAEAECGRVMDELNYVGVLAIEFFVKDGRLLGNEMAPRVHNSGHWTIEGAATSQFENHLRAICGFPLGDCAARGHAAMVNLIGSSPPVEELLAHPGAHAHLYGKQPRAGRKLGHVTLVDHDAARLETRLNPILAAGCASGS